MGMVSSEEHFKVYLCEHRIEETIKQVSPFPLKVILVTITWSSSVLCIRKMLRSNLFSVCTSGHRKQDGGGEENARVVDFMASSWLFFFLLILSFQLWGHFRALHGNCCWKHNFSLLSQWQGEANEETKGPWSFFNDFLLKISCIAHSTFLFDFTDQKYTHINICSCMQRRKYKV